MGNHNPTNTFANRMGDINRNGRPKKGMSMTEILNTYGEQKKIKINGVETDMKEAVAVKLYELALKGDVSALKYIYDRIDGKPKETIDLNDKREDKLAQLMEKITELK